MAYNKQVNPYGVASSELGWKGFADGGKHGNPGAVQVKDNPYAKFAAQMIGDIAWNAGKEFSAPEYKGIDELTGQPVYEQSGFSRAVYGPYPTPRGSILKRNLPAAHDAFNSRKTATDAQAKINADAEAKVIAEAAAKAAAEQNIIDNSGAPGAANRTGIQQVNPNASVMGKWWERGTAKTQLADSLKRSGLDMPGVGWGWLPGHELFLETGKGGELASENKLDAYRDWLAPNVRPELANKTAAYKYFTSQPRQKYDEYIKLKTYEERRDWFAKNIAPNTVWGQHKLIGN